MMTKDGDAASTVPSLVSMPPQAAVLVTLPTTATTAIGHGLGQATAVKEESDEDMPTTFAVPANMVTSISNVRANHATLQSLLAAPISASRVIPNQEQTIQVITLPTTSDLITTSQPDGAGRVWQMVPTIGNGEMATIIAVADASELIQATKTDIGDGIDLGIQEAAGELPVTAADTMAAILMPPPPPPDCPAWASRMNNCEKIGESYRGYVENEAELDLLLTYHKQQTSSFWGTRQSPSPAKPSTRLMWKSQYVPFDGIPFVNIGSRAVVMECQYGPRRKGNASKRYRDGSTVKQYCQTCPARIYIKRVRKFPDYAVDLRQDKKALRVAMDKAFQELRERPLDGWGSERFYVQLPTIKAHEFHDEIGGPEKKEQVAFEECTSGSEGMAEDVRLHPKLVQKLRSMVAGGETKVYDIRRELRAYVLREMFAGSDSAPERHDLTLFPTVNDLKNHIHQALKDIENGTLGITAPMVNVEILPDGGNHSGDMEEGEERLAALLDRGLTPALAMPETVTVTLTQNPDAEGHHIISRIETHLSDGTTQVSTTLTPETAQLLSKLHPAIFPADSLMQLGGSQPNGELSPTELDSSEGRDVAASLSDSADSTTARMSSVVDACGIEDGAGEVMQVVSPDDACSHILQASSCGQGAVDPVQMPVAVSGEDSSLGEADKMTGDVLVGDAEMITISMTEDNQLVLASPVSETFGN